jgi:hypothetical protein
MHQESAKDLSKRSSFVGDTQNSLSRFLGGNKNMMDMFTVIIMLALIGGGFLVLHRLLERRKMMTSSMGMPWQREYEDGPRDEYGRGFNPNPGYDGSGYERPMYGPSYRNPEYESPTYGPGYARPMYGPGYPPPQTGMNPWAAGGLGAVGGGLLGYELGRMAGGHEQQAQEGDPMNPDQTATLAQDGYDPGMADAIGPFDVGGFSDVGEGFGSGDFGGGSDW